MPQSATPSSPRSPGPSTPRSLRRSMCLALLAGALALPAAATVSYRLNDPALAARIDGAPVTAFSVDALWRLARIKEPQAARSAVLEEVVLNRLLSAAARERFDEAQLYAGQRVGFTRDVALDDQLVATLRTLYDQDMQQALRQLPGGTLDGLIVDQAKPTPAALDAVFGKPEQLKLEFTLNAGQLTRARDIVLLRYTLPSGAGTVTLYDVYRRQNVQGRVALYNRQPDFLQQQAKQDLAARFVLDWSRRRFGDTAIADLRRVLAERGEVHALRQLHGIGDDIESTSPLLQRLAGEVTPAQIAAYYTRHRSEFTRIERVKARHIRLADESSAQTVFKALNNGADFAATARRHSIAADAGAGGTLGWIRHEGKPDWLAQLALAQPEGPPSRPIRTPAGPHDAAAWEIIQVEQRVMGYQAPDSEAVRYAASNALARSTAQTQLAALRQQLLRTAQIDINRGLLDQPLQTLDAK
ncbi:MULTISPECIES: peptidylprolyl isomerase [unclassified Duganella]|uniref:peptidylprolyl isomerase n=1 Tax=unclassified Duganella TaxID=2636909 RepID=UPI001E284471|nr:MULTISPECIES: peptidylprolyl isomerase [unclassified Duganella]